MSNRKLTLVTIKNHTGGGGSFFWHRSDRRGGKNTQVLAPFFFYLLLGSCGHALPFTNATQKEVP
jgi:hypothetical protein